MRADGAMKLAMLAAAMLWETRYSEGARTYSTKLCGRALSDIMSRVCRTYNSPWDDLTGKQTVF